MPHHLLAYSGSVVNGAVGIGIPTINDAIATPFGTTTYTLGSSLEILRAFMMGPNVSVVQLDSPTLRPIGPPNIQPFSTAAAPESLPPINKLDDSSLPWPAMDPLAVPISRAGAGAAVCQALLWVSTSRQQPTPGRSRTVRFTAAVVAGTGAWVGGNLALAQNLPPGRYRVIGMAIHGANVFAGRLIFPQAGDVWRPGVLGQQAAGEYDHEWFRRGNFGTFGEFNSWAPPSLEVLGYAASTITQEVYLDLVPLF